jgi:hypothetical protein
MAEFPMTFTQLERQFLLALLETKRKDMQVEEHRTRSPAYRAHILHEEERIDGLLKKFRPAPESGEPTGR